MGVGVLGESIPAFHHGGAEMRRKNSREWQQNAIALMSLPFGGFPQRVGLGIAALLAIELN
jgi:hypothetical protein